jgi:uncharacterized membrane protein
MQNSFIQLSGLVWINTDNKTSRFCKMTKTKTQLPVYTKNMKNTEEFVERVVTDDMYRCLYKSKKINIRPLSCRAGAEERLL